MITQISVSFLIVIVTLPCLETGRVSNVSYDIIDMEDERDYPIHNLWIKPAVNKITKWKSGGIVWTGPWRYEHRGRQGLNCWYCNVYWTGTPVGGQGGQGGQGIQFAPEPGNCLAYGTDCNENSMCCDDAGDPDENLCNPVTKKCVFCRPGIGEECYRPSDGQFYFRCCRSDEEKRVILCYPLPGANEEEDTQGICKELDCAVNSGDACNSKPRGCCPGLECVNGQCEDCRDRQCGNCCKSYRCREGECQCETRLHFRCTPHDNPCCPPRVCSNVPDSLILPGARAEDARENLCVGPDNCANGTPCKSGRCINNVCLHTCVQRGYVCGGPGDNRKCCGNNVCYRSCDNYCAGHYANYCSPRGGSPSGGCKCGIGSVCRRNGDCHDSCCMYPKNSDCQGIGRCRKKIPGGCHGGQNGAVTSGYVGKGNTGYTACPGRGRAELPWDTPLQ